MNRLAPYERRVIELLRNSKDKRARKLAKKRVRLHPASPNFSYQISFHSKTATFIRRSVSIRTGSIKTMDWLTQLQSQLGTFGRAKRKVDELQGVIAESRRAGH